MQCVKRLSRERNVTVHYLHPESEAILIFCRRLITVTYILEYITPSVCFMKHIYLK